MKSPRSEVSNERTPHTKQGLLRRQLTKSNLATVNDNEWSTSLYSEPPLLTSATCVKALHEFFSSPDVLAVATESSSHPTGLTSVLAQPWLYAGGGLGNIPECPLQTCKKNSIFSDDFFFYSVFLCPLLNITHIFTFPSNS